jgi:hypothetical protein
LTEADPVTPLLVAEMLVPPTWTAFTSPPVDTVAVAAAPLAQVTWPVRSRVVPSLYAPVAASCCVIPTGMLGVAGVTWMAVRVAGVVPPPPLEQPATPARAATMATTNDEDTALADDRFVLIGLLTVFRPGG